MSDAAAKAVRVVIEGRVQGVGYRAWTCRHASGLGLSGWVRNRRDGSVEAVFHGPAAQVDAMLADCRRGPSAARVDAVRAVPEDGPVEPGFDQLPTA